VPHLIISKSWRLFLSQADVYAILPSNFESYIQQNFDMATIALFLALAATIILAPPPWTPPDQCPDQKKCPGGYSPACPGNNKCEYGRCHDGSYSPCSFSGPRTPEAFCRSGGNPQCKDSPSAWEECWDKSWAPCVQYPPYASPPRSGGPNYGQPPSYPNLPSQYGGPPNQNKYSPQQPPSNNNNGGSSTPYQHSNQPSYPPTQPNQYGGQPQNQYTPPTNDPYAHQNIPTANDLYAPQYNNTYCPAACNAQQFHGTDVHLPESSSI
jgi:hypothetical protein